MSILWMLIVGCPIDLVFKTGSGSARELAFSSLMMFLRDAEMCFSA